MTSRRRLLRWAHWFAAVHAGLLALIGLSYLWLYVRLSPTVALVYAPLAYLGHMAVLAYLPIFLFVLPLILLLPRPRVVVPLGVGLASVAAGFLMLDSLVFAENRYHLNILTATLLGSHTWLFLGIYFGLALAIEGMLARAVWQRTATAPTRHVGRYLALGLALCFAAANLMHAWFEARYDVSVTSLTRYLPLYFPLRDARIQVRLGLVDRRVARERGVMAALGRRPPAGELRYPLHPLTCAPPRRTPNVLLIVVDAMRADVLTPRHAPRMSEFARGATRFASHYSGGNSSRAGMFSFFYSLPATYWDAFAGFARPPLLMDLFRQHDYQIGVFASSPVYGTVGLDRTALARIPNLRLETSSPYPGSSGRDRTLTEDWLRWLDQRDPARPFLGFLYYNAVVASEPPDDSPHTFRPPAESTRLQRVAALYLSAVHFVDGLVGQVLDDLRRRQLLDDLVVLITSDHGMEFDENGLGFSGHGTSYSEYQMHTPLVLHWPGRPGGIIERRTSHNDLAPTFLSGLFGCTNPPSDYSSGHDLYSDAPWSWLIAASYAEFALIEPERVTIVYPAYYEIRGRDYGLIPRATPPRAALLDAQKEMGRFYR
jgi:membrane-anchored protein YejM (alkaline phosphatase superfamily)